MAKTLKSGKNELYTSAVNGIKPNSSIMCKSTNYNKCDSRMVRYIVCHYTGNSKDLAVNNAKYFKNNVVEASAHFFVDDTSIYQSVKMNDIAWHCGANSYKHATCRNDNSIGVEMCCTAGNYKISSKTKKNAAYLVASLCKYLGIKEGDVSDCVLRHWDVTGKNCPAQMTGNRNAEWEDFILMVRNILKNGDEDYSYKVQISSNTISVRKGAGMNYKATGTTVKKGEVFTIVEEKVNDGVTFGRLKSGAGWIPLKATLTKKVS